MSAVMSPGRSRATRILHLFRRARAVITLWPEATLMEDVEGIRIEVALGREKKEEGIRIEVALGGATRTRRGAGSCDSDPARRRRPE
ncbi:MAG: hypothetical protein HY815_07300 [Candidatus Riflebacteria bacterium]|nr:hypothetical protein [Candidatus Riflebacteria bacterium]